jgi:hypothetical protein
VKPEKWNPVCILDQGMYVRGSSSSSSSSSSSPSSGAHGCNEPNPKCSGDLKILKDKFGQAVNTPQLLCNGQQSTTPCYIAFDVYLESTFTGNIP